LWYFLTVFDIYYKQDEKHILYFNRLHIFFLNKPFIMIQPSITLRQNIFCRKKGTRYEDEGIILLFKYFTLLYAHIILLLFLIFSFSSSMMIECFLQN